MIIVFASVPRPVGPASPLCFGPRAILSICRPEQSPKFRYLRSSCGIWSATTGRADYSREHYPSLGKSLGKATISTGHSSLRADTGREGDFSRITPRTRMGSPSDLFGVHALHRRRVVDRRPIRRASAKDQILGGLRMAADKETEDRAACASRKTGSRHHGWLTKRRRYPRSARRT